jgi:hypothetical protein
MDWSVQVKTNRKDNSFWHVGKSALTLRSRSHIYVFVNLRGSDRPDYIVATSGYVADHVKINPSSTGSVWYEFHRKDRPTEGEGWESFSVDP